MQESTKKVSYLVNVVPEITIGTVFLLCSIFLLICFFRTKKAGSWKIRHKKKEAGRNSIVEEGGFPSKINPVLQSRHPAALQHQPAFDPSPPQQQIREKNYHSTTNSQSIRSHQKSSKPDTDHLLVSEQHTATRGRKPDTDHVLVSEQHTATRGRSKRKDNNGHVGKLKSKSDHHHKTITTPRLSCSLDSVHFQMPNELTTDNHQATTPKLVKRYRKHVTNREPAKTKENEPVAGNSKLVATNLQHDNSRVNDWRQTTVSTTNQFLPMSVSDLVTDRRPLMGWISMNQQQAVSDPQTAHMYPTNSVAISSQQNFNVATANNLLSDDLPRAVISNQLARINLFIPSQWSARTNNFMPTKSVYQQSVPNLHVTEEKPRPSFTAWISKEETVLVKELPVPDDTKPSDLGLGLEKELPLSHATNSAMLQTCPFIDDEGTFYGGFELVDVKKRKKKRRKRNKLGPGKNMSNVDEEMPTSFLFTTYDPTMFEEDLKNVDQSSLMLGGFYNDEKTHIVPEVPVDEDFPDAKTSVKKDKKSAMIFKRKVRKPSNVKRDSTVI